MLDTQILPGNCKPPHKNLFNPFRERCINSLDEPMKEKSTAEQFGPYDLYQPRQRYDVYDKRPNNRFEANKRSLDSDYEDDAIQKRQVGVVYGNGKPIGILQPYQKTYKFIPVKEDASAGIDKREASRPADKIQEDYPSILAKFKISNKMDQKRLSSQLKRDDRTGLRHLRSTNTEHIEDKLKSILDDMGLLDETHNKRQIEEEDVKEREKREDVSTESPCNPESENKRENDAEKRRKREKDDLLQNLEESGELTVTGNKSPLASSEVETRDLEKEDSEYDKDMEKKIKNKINSLQDEVKREIEDLKDQEDNQRKKRHVTLLDQENADLDPMKVLSDSSLKPLRRKRRDTDSSGEETKTKGNRMRKKRQESREKEEEEQESLFDDADMAMKREVPDNFDRNKRSQLMNDNEELYDYYVDDAERSKRQNYENYEYVVPVNYGSKMKRFNLRLRRRVDEPIMVENVNRPQQLSDMSEVDLFGALPKNYDGELMRYKRVKRNKNRS